jgi:hypothetical protein
MHADLIAKLEALSAWSTATVKVFTGQARQKIELPYALVNPDTAEQFQCSTGIHPIHKAHGFTVAVYSATQLQADSLARTAWEALRDFTGKLTPSSSRIVEASDSPSDPQSQLIPPGNGSEELCFVASFSVQFISKAA